MVLANSSGQYGVSKLTVGPLGQAKYSGATAFADALAAAVSGDTIYVFPGTYTETPITWKAGVSVVGATSSSDSTSVTIVGNQSFASPGTFYFSDINFSTTAGLTIGDAGAGAAIVSMTSCNVISSAGATVTLLSAAGSGELIATDCEFLAVGGEAIAATTNGVATINHCVFSSNAAAAFVLGTNATFTMQDSLVTASAGDSVLVSDAAAVLLSKRNKYQATGVGVSFSAAGAMQSIEDDVDAGGANVMNGAAAGTVSYSFLTCSGTANTFGGAVVATPYSVLPAAAAAISTITGEGAGGATGATVDFKAATGNTTFLFSAAASAVTLGMTDASANTVAGASNTNSGTTNTVFGTLNNSTGNNNTLYGWTNNSGSGAACVLIGYNNGRAGSGNSNIGVGVSCIQGVTTGGNNVFMGQSVLGNIGGGANNLGIGPTIGGQGVGSALTTTDSSNLIIGHVGVAGDNNTIRIGTSGAGASQQNKSFVAGIRGITTVNNDAIAVLIDSAGQLGTVSSSRRFKMDIKPIADSEKLQQLRPVQFRYKKYEDSSKLEYGLIAEDVEGVLPDLVVYDAEGSPETVQYHKLFGLMLAEIQRLSKEVEGLKAKCH